MHVQANMDIFFCPLFYRKESRLYILFYTENSFKRTNRIMVPLCSKFSHVSTWAPWAGQLFMTDDWLSQCRVRVPASISKFNKQPQAL